MGEPVKILVVDLRKPGKCTTCGAVKSLRPMGENDQLICEECWKKIPDGQQKLKDYLEQFDHVVYMED